MSSFESNLYEHLLADYKVVGVNTTEEGRAVNSVLSVVNTINTKRKTTREQAIAEGKTPPNASAYHMVLWNTVLGFYPMRQESLPRELQDVLGDSKYKAPDEALKFIQEYEPAENISTVFVMCDLDTFFQAPPVRLRVKSISEVGLPKSHSHVIIVSAAFELSKFPKLANMITMLDFVLPGPEELEKATRQLEEDVEMVCEDAVREKIVQSLRGLTKLEAVNTLSRALVRKREWGEETLEVIRAEKANIINQSDSLKYIDAETIAQYNDLAGYDDLLQSIKAQCVAYTKEAREALIDLPKGICLAGVPGTGKSVAAMMIAKSMGLPLFTLDIGSVFAAHVGDSEANLRFALQQVTAQDGCVLMIDEVDKALNNAHNATGDSGVTSRVFGTLLSWLSNKIDRTFVLVTANRPDRLPPEFFRAGRFDAMWYTDIPTAAERRAIFEIHLQKRGVNPAEALDEECWTTVLNKTTDFVGSEVEQAVKNARYISFSERQSGIPIIAEWLRAIQEITPLYKIDLEGVKAIQDFCKSRAKPVNGNSVSQRDASLAVAPTRRKRNVGTAN